MVKNHLGTFKGPYVYLYISVACTEGVYLCEALLIYHYLNTQIYIINNGEGV
jgi:hypothetical protein